jgi:hypothetical protein
MNTAATEPAHDLGVVDFQLDHRVDGDAGRSQRLGLHGCSWETVEEEAAAAIEAVDDGRKASTAPLVTSCALMPPLVLYCHSTTSAFRS